MTDVSVQRWRAGYWQKQALWLYLIGILAWWLADIAVLAIDPWHELELMATGLLTPDLGRMEYLLQAIWQTVAFALLGVALSLLIGLPLALVYRHPLVAAVCAFIRAIHELFWALLLMQIFGLSALTGILAIALPFAATFARVFHDMLTLTPGTLDQHIPGDRISRYVYGRVANVWPQMESYIRYRFECALRSSAVLGFIGLPTLGFYLESAYSQGHYHLGGALLLLFILLIGTLKYWCHRWLIPVMLLLAIIWLPQTPQLDSLALLTRFIADLVPYAVANASGVEGVMTAFQSWLLPLVSEQIWPGLIATLTLALAALVLTHLLSLLSLPLACRRFWPLWFIGRGASLALRSTPEYLLAFIFVLLLGPSMLPGILALALHNAALLVFLSSRQADALPVEEIGLSRMDDWHFRVLPVIYPNTMALLFYRFEVILRESAILGIIGVATLGFYVDSAFSELRYGNAMVLLLAVAALNILVDAASRAFLARADKPVHC